MNALQATVGGTTGPVFEQLVDPLTAPPTAGLVSPDRTTVRLVARVPGDGDTLVARLEPVPALVADLKAAHPGYRIHALNNTLTNDEISELINGGLDASLRLTIPLTFIILLSHSERSWRRSSRCPRGYVAAGRVRDPRALQPVRVPVSPYASQLVVLIGLAVAVDYSLFMVTRSERSGGMVATSWRRSTSRATRPVGRSFSRASP